MLYQIVEIKRGKETVKMTDSLRKCNNRLEELRSSYRGSKGKSIRFELRPTEETQKFEAKPAPGGYQSGDRQTPRLTKWDEK